MTDESSAPVPRDLAKRLGVGGIRVLLVILCDAYRNLYTRGYVRADTPEDDITEEWYIHIQKRWRTGTAFGLIPVPQKQDREKAHRRGRPPTIDFCFRDAFSPQSYFGAECKLLDEGSTRHLKAYLDDQQGIGRFLSGKYAAHTGTGTMVGYVRHGSPNNVAKDLAMAIQRLPGKPKLRKSPPLPRFDQIYESRHNRKTGITPFLCFHLLFSFKCSAD